MRQQKTFASILRPKRKNGKNRGKKSKKRAKGIDFGWLKHLANKPASHHTSTGTPQRWYW